MACLTHNYNREAYLEIQSLRIVLLLFTCFSLAYSQKKKKNFENQQNNENLFSILKALWF